MLVIEQSDFIYCSIIENNKYNIKGFERSELMALTEFIYLSVANKEAEIVNKKREEELIKIKERMQLQKEKRLSKLK